MPTVAVVPTADPTNSPPRVLLTVTSTGTPYITSTTITRTDNSGTVSAVRTPDGGPLVLTLSGSSYVGTVYDYEAPFGVPVTYSTVETPTSVSGAVTIDSADVWLIHPGVPGRSMTVDLRAGSFAEEDLPANSGVFWPLGSAYATVVTDGARKNGGSSFTVALESLADVAALRALIADSGVLLLNVPPALGWGIDAVYIAILDVKAQRVSDVGSSPYRNYVCPYVPTRAPVGGTQAEWTWADVVATYPTWLDVIAANPTWADLQAPTS